MQISQNNVATSNSHMVIEIIKTFLYSKLITGMCMTHDSNDVYYKFTAVVNIT